MDYILVSIITLTIAAISQVVLFKIYYKYRPKKVSVKGTQSSIYHAISPIVNHFMSYSEVAINLNTQSQKHYTDMLQGDQTKVVLSGDDAYWIKDGQFYTAKFEQNRIVMESKKIVDTMGMDTVELEKISKVVDKLSERDVDDFGNPGNQIF